MNDMLEKNLLYLYHNNKMMFERIQSYLDSNNAKHCKLVFEEGDRINLTYALQDEVKNLYTTDGSEIDIWLQEHGKLKQGHYDVVMYGLGLTHHLARLIEQNQLLNFYIFEPEIDIFIEALKIIDLEQLLQHPQVKLLEVGNDPGVIRSFHLKLNTYSEYTKVEVYIPFYTTINLEIMRDFYKSSYSIREGQLFANGFERSFGTQPYRNSIRNLEMMSKSTPIKSLQSNFKGCTALIVGAGPSLELDVQLIKENYDKFLIIAAGSSIQSLLYYGIKPHLIVSMDPSEANGRVFRNIDTSSIPFVFMPQIYYGILKEKFARVFYGLFSNDPITNYLFSDVKIDYNFIPTNSVTGTAIQIAKYLGAESIVLTGQDLSFPNENYYAQGATHHDTKELQDKVLSSDMEVENVNGTFNQTNFSMKSTLEDIENLISNIMSVKFVNTSALGAKIKGADFSPLSELISTLHSPTHDFSSIIATEETVAEVDFNSLVERIEGFIETSNQLIASNENSLRIIQKIDELSRRNPSKAVRMLAKLEQEFSTVTEHRLFLTIIPRWNRGLTKKYDQQVIKIASEPTIVGKARLVKEIVEPYIRTINESFDDLKEEFQELLDRLVQSK
ncbi:motility associated factor glycosyltransferase family protein [Paenibacillus sp. FSL W7-1287]|uniref:motility associated factor glycosyltransferase family protein n=1 Tax=Paenibacillus sp. FSL W7-1287 TaxID=2954538 RepID=UPI0030FCAE2A